jgi:hypothetical protein
MYWNADGIERLPRSKRRSTLQERFDLIRTKIRAADWTDEVSLALGRIKATLERRGISDWATTSQRKPRPVSWRCSPYPHGPASFVHVETDEKRSRLLHG